MFYFLKIGFGYFNERKFIMLIREEIFQNVICILEITYFPLKNNDALLKYLRCINSWKSYNQVKTKIVKVKCIWQYKYNDVEIFKCKIFSWQNRLFVIKFQFIYIKRIQFTEETSINPFLIRIKF